MHVRSVNSLFSTRAPIGCGVGVERGRVNQRYGPYARSCMFLVINRSFQSNAWSTIVERQLIQTFPKLSKIDESGRASVGISGEYYFPVHLSEGQGCQSSGLRVNEQEGKDSESLARAWRQQSFTVHREGGHVTS